MKCSCKHIDKFIYWRVLEYKYTPKGFSKLMCTKCLNIWVGKDDNDFIKNVQKKVFKKSNNG